MQYRDGGNAYGARGSPYPPVPSNEPPDTDLNDDAPPGYSDDRVQNDLLDEICSDFGIKDSMDLDFYFDTDPVGGEFQPVADPITVLPVDPCKVELDKVDSPTVSSSSEDGAKLSSVGPAPPPVPAAPHGSPQVHSTTEPAPSVDASEPTLRTEAETGRSSASSSSSCPSAAVPSASVPGATVPSSSVPPQRSTSVDSNSSMPAPASPRHQRKSSAAVSTESLKTSTVSGTTLSKTSGFTANLKQDLYTSFSQPASPAKGVYPGGNMGSKITHSYSHDNIPHAARSLTGHKAFHMPQQVMYIIPR